jgi:hypothetical protein
MVFLGKYGKIERVEMNYPQETQKKDFTFSNKLVEWT